jgi:uncharacterized RDD family membrane protein YckC
VSTPQPQLQNPYAPPTAPVQDVSDQGELAGRGSRLWAYLIDILTWCIVWFPTAVVATRNWHFDEEPLENFVNRANWFSGGLAVVLLVVTALLVARNGQTIGKKAVGIRVVRSDGSKASLGRIFWMRNVVNAIPRAIPYVGFLYLLVDVLMIFGEARRCLHDRIADTIVVKC